MVDTLQICDLGRLDYDRALKIQYKLLERRQQDMIGDTLLLVEHPPVLTLGARGRYENIFLPREMLAEAGIQIYEVNRGGDVTYHGPGQVVGYPIMKIEHFPGSIRGFVSSIETGLINLLRAEYGIDATQRHDKYTGVWVGDCKIVAIGIAVKQWVTMHGFAFNVNTNLSHFEWINPCGLSMGVTSVEKLIGQTVDFEKVKNLVGCYFAEAFIRTPITCELADLVGEIIEETGKGMD
jgi:lipoyl(octanoyl) transferase